MSKPASLKVANNLIKEIADVWPEMNGSPLGERVKLRIFEHFGVAPPEIDDETLIRFANPKATDKLVSNHEHMDELKRDLARCARIILDERS